MQLSEEPSGLHEKIGIWGSEEPPAYCIFLPECPESHSKL